MYVIKDEQARRTKRNIPISRRNISPSTKTPSRLVSSSLSTERCKKGRFIIIEKRQFLWNAAERLGGTAHDLWTLLRAAVAASRGLWECALQEEEEREGAIRRCAGGRERKEREICRRGRRELSYFISRNGRGIRPGACKKRV